MSKVPYTINIKEYVCEALEEIRTMVKVLDFSRLPARIEHIQHHVNRMEAGLHEYNTAKRAIQRVLEDEELSDSDKLAKIEEKLSRVD